MKNVRRFIEASPHEPDARILADLVLALENETGFTISELYALDGEHFALALELLKDWRIDRYYLGKARLFDISWQHRELRSPSDT